MTDGNKCGKTDDRGQMKKDRRKKAGVYVFDIIL